MKAKLTILTEPIPSLKKYYWESIKRFIRPIVRLIDRKQPLIIPKYTGHYAVTRSLVEGLSKINYPFNYNPKKLRKVAKHVHVLANIEALKQAIELKKTGKIEKLTAGPNIVEYPQEITTLKDYSLIDAYYFPSQWTIDLWFQLDNKFILETRLWYAGVNTDYWNFSNKEDTKNILFYIKSTKIEINNYVAYVKENGYNALIIKYGEYNIEDFKQYLNKSSLMVYFMETESQGIALFEAWSMNVPCFIYETGKFEYNGKHFNSSSAPYLSKETGSFFNNIKTFETLLTKFRSSNYSPRNWIINKGSDEYSANEFIKIQIK